MSNNFFYSRIAQFPLKPCKKVITNSFILIKTNLSNFLMLKQIGRLKIQVTRGAQCNTNHSKRQRVRATEKLLQNMHQIQAHYLAKYPDKVHPFNSNLTRIAEVSNVPNCSFYYKFSKIDFKGDPISESAARFFVIILKFILTSIFGIKIHGKNSLKPKKFHFQRPILNNHHIFK